MVAGDKQLLFTLCSSKKGTKNDLFAGWMKNESINFKSVLQDVHDKNYKQKPQKENFELSLSWWLKN